MSARVRRIARGFLCGLAAGVVTIAAMLFISAITGFTNTIFLLVGHLHGSAAAVRWSLFVSALIFHLVVCGILGALLAILNGKRRALAVATLTSLLIAFSLVHWHLLGTNLLGWPAETARVATALSLFMAVILFERTLALLLQEMNVASTTVPYGPDISRRAIVYGGLGLIASGGAAALIRRLYRVAAFRHDGIEYKGASIKPITPRNEFYCVTNNFIDPRVDSGLWHLEVDGLVQTPHTWRIQDLRGMPPTDQETTLMSSRNLAGGGLISNAIWTGVSLRELLIVASPLSAAAAVRFGGVDGHAEFMALDDAMDPDVLLAHKINGELLPYRQGHPLRLIVPGAYGERSVKWLSNIELVGENELQRARAGVSRVPTFARIDVPAANAKLTPDQRVEMKGVAFAGGREISRVDVSDDGGKSWNAAVIDYSATPMAWIVWRFDWNPSGPGERSLSVRVSDAEQATICHAITVAIAGA